MPPLDLCTKCKHYEAWHRQRDVRNYALDECGKSGCFCLKYSRNKKYINKFTDQGIPKILSEDEKSDYAINRIEIFEGLNCGARRRLEKKALEQMKLERLN